MIKIKREDLINYIKDNIDTSLDFTDIELNLDTRDERLDGTILVFPYIETTIKIDYANFVEYIHREREALENGKD